MGAIDTHAVVKQLKAVGFSEEQAEVLAGQQARLLEENLATKQDVAELRRDLAQIEASLKRDIADVRRYIEEVRTELKRDLAEMENRLTIRLGGMLVIAVGAMAALVKLL